jgi:hypothetical protein
MRRVIIHFFLCFVAMSIFTPGLFGSVTFAASPACDQIEAFNTVTTGDWTIPLSSALQPGDYIAIDVTPAGGSPTSATLEVPNGTVVAVIGLPGTLTHTVSSAGATAIRVFLNTGTAVIDWSCGDVPTPPSSSDKTKRAPGPPAMNLFDGRINNLQDRDVAAPVAIYEGSIKVYGIDPISGDGRLDVDISQEAIDAVGIPVDVPVLLGQGKNHYTGIDIFVYRLPTGEFQLNTHYPDGKPYIFAWDTEHHKWHFAW